MNSVAHSLMSLPSASFVVLQTLLLAETKLADCLAAPKVVAVPEAVAALEVVAAPKVADSHKH